LKWHPDRHHSRYDKELATGYFAEVSDLDHLYCFFTFVDPFDFYEATNAYRTLVREGHLKYPRVPVVNNIQPKPHPTVQQPPLMTQKTSSQSSLLSLDSFIHLVASSTESHTTPSSSIRESFRSSWKQGIRIPSEAISSQYRNTAADPPVSTFHYDAPRRGVKGPAMYKPVTVPIAAQFQDQQKRTKAPKSSSVKLGGKLEHQR
jgi:hypothetical protein